MSTETGASRPNRCTGSGTRVAVVLSQSSVTVGPNGERIIRQGRARCAVCGRDVAWKGDQTAKSPAIALKHQGRTA